MTEKRIIKVYNYDGPGFNKEIIRKYKTSSVLKKIETYYPQDSVIGRIMNHEEKCTVTLSNEKGIYQHDIYSWQVMKNDLVKSDSSTEGSDIINETLNDWLKNTTVEQRRLFFDSIFDLFYATEANTFKEIMESLSKNMMKIMKSYNKIEENDKKEINKMIRLFAKAYINIIKEKEKTKYNNMREYNKIQNERKLSEFQQKYLKRIKSNN